MTTLTHRRLIAQRALVAAHRAMVNAAIIERDDAEGCAAHADLIRAELRLYRMEGRLRERAEAAGGDFEVTE